MTCMELVLGTAQLTRPYGVLSASQFSEGDSPQELFRAARESGFSALDTAALYGNAEEAIGSVDHGLKVHTKLDPALDPEKSVHQSLRRLGVSFIDVVYLHEEFSGSRAQKETLQHLHTGLRSKIGAVGVSIYSEAEFFLALETPEISAIQLPLSALDRKFGPDHLAQASGAGTSVFARSIFLQGLLLIPSRDIPRRVKSLGPYVEQFQKIADRHGVSYADAALHFTKSYPGLAGIVIGANTVANIIEIAQSFHREQPTEFLDEFLQVASPPAHLTDPRLWT